MSGEAQAVMNALTGARAFLPGSREPLDNRLWIIDNDGGAWWAPDEAELVHFFPGDIGSHWGEEVDVPDWFIGNAAAAAGRQA